MTDVLYILSLMAFAATAWFFGYCHGERVAAGRYRKVLDIRAEDAAVRLATRPAHRGRGVPLRRMKFRRGAP